MSVTDVSLGGWYWAAVNYIVRLQLPKRSQLSFSASLSAKLAVPQLFMDAHGLFLPTDVSQIVWKWDCVQSWNFRWVWRAVAFSQCRGCISCWSRSIAQVLYLLTHANNPLLVWHRITEIPCLSQKTQKKQLWTYEVFCFRSTTFSLEGFNTHQARKKYSSAC